MYQCQASPARGTLLLAVFLSAMASRACPGATLPTAPELKHVPVVDSHRGVQELGRLREALGALPLCFEPNLGQLAAGVDFVARGRGYRLALTSGAATIFQGGDLLPWLHLQLVGSRPDAAIQPVERLPGKFHYFLGDQSAGGGPTCRPLPGSGSRRCIPV